MYGVVEISGHQYQVKSGKIVDVQQLDVKEGSHISLEKVLFIGEGGSDSENSEVKVGKPYISGAKVQAKVIGHDRGKKILVYKRNPGKYEVKRGHRQCFTSLLITELTDGSGKVDKLDENSPEAQKYLQNQTV